MQYKIAIIDDNLEDIFAIRRMLLKTNLDCEYLLFEFTNPEEALIELTNSTIDCILLDYNLPIMNGLEFIQKFRNKQNIDTPVILLTGQGNEKIAVESFKNGAFDYIVKSEISAELLKKSILKGIEKRNFERSEKTHNEFIKTMVDIIPAPLFYKDRNGAFLGCNKAYEDFFNKKKEEIIGKTQYELSNNDSVKLLEEMDNQLFKNPGAQTYEYEYENSNKEQKYIVFNNVTFNNSLGEVNGIIGIINDITETKARESELIGRAFFDSLTGILNRRYFDENIETEWRKCLREKKPLSLIMIDIDLFKSYNDYYGHLEGDNCIKKIAQEIKNSVLRPFDILTRYGGEEFVAILPYTNAIGALNVAKRIKENIIKLAIKNEALSINKIVTVSQGVSQINNKDDSVITCLENADKALYIAKNNGRNAIESLI